MANNSVGEISLDLILNSKQFDKKLKNAVNSSVKTSEKAVAGLGSTFAKIGTLAAAAFSVGAIVKFGTACVKLGSDLEEVQNVVDVTFGNMSEAANEWAKNALKDFGIGEIAAKNYLSTFASMAKGMGYSTDAAFEMSKELTGLTGDLASFRNLSQDEAFTKLKAIFTGETEGLKSLGVVMTEANLDAFALANGFGKVSKQMTQQEKIALRLAFVENALADAQGDFKRSGDSWANQMRVLSGTFDSLKAQIGQGLIQALKPALKMLNLLMQKLLDLATVFNKVTAQMFGKDTSSAGGGLTALTEEAMAASGGIESIGDAATDAKKKIQKSMAGFDELNTLSDNSADLADNLEGIDPTGQSSLIGDNEELKDTPKWLNAIASAFEGIKNRAKELWGEFKDGYNSVVDENNFDGLIADAKTLGAAVMDIFGDPRVQDSANNFADKYAEALGKVAGSAVSIGTSTAEFFVGSLAKYFDESKDFLAETISNDLNIAAHIVEQSGNVSAAVAEIFTAFRSDEWKQLGADVISVIVDPLLYLQEVLLKFTSDVFDVITQPIIDNAESIKQALINMAEFADKPIKQLKETIHAVGDAFLKMYDEHIHPLFESLKKGLSDTFGKFMEVYHKYIEPFIKRVTDGTKELIKNNIEPMLLKFTNFIGKVADLIKTLYEEYLKPAIDWIIKNVIPVIVPILEDIWNTVKDVFGHIFNIIGDLFDILGGIIDFIIGVFTGDWDRAWDGICAIFGGFIDIIKEAVLGVWDFIKGIFSTIIDTVSGYFQTMFKAISDWLSSVWTRIKNSWESFKKNAVDGVSRLWETIKSSVSNYVKDIINKIVEVFSNIWNKASEFKRKFENGLSNALNTFKNVFVSAFKSIKTTITDIFEGIWNAIKKPINTILGGVEKMVKGITDGLNKAIDALNDLEFDVPDWVPLIGGRSFGLRIPRLYNSLYIPKLAEGGYVNANTPQLAMIGDNKHEGEIVAPESKITEAVSNALGPIVGVLGNLATAMQNGQLAGAGDITIPIYLDGNKLENFVIKASETHNLRTGGFR